MQRTIKSNRRHRSYASFLIGALVLGFVVLVVQASTPTPFAVVVEPIGVVATPERLLVTSGFEDMGPREIVQIDGLGNVTHFATLPGGLPNEEDYLTVSVGKGGFLPGYVYAAQGSVIYEITPDGSSVTEFVTIPGLPYSYVDLTFDKVGTFGYDLIVTGGGTGMVYRVNSEGVATLVGNAGVVIEGPDVAPTSFGPQGGQLWAASNTGWVVAMSPTGVLSYVVPWTDAERIHFVPDCLRSMNDNDGVFFAADYPNQIIKYPLSDFVGLEGKAIVTGEYGNGIARIDYSGTEYVLSQFCNFPAHHEGSDFVDSECGGLEVPIDVKPTSCPNPFNLGKSGVLPVAILGTAAFDATKVDPTSVRLEGITPLRSAQEDVATPFYPFVGRTACSDCTTEGPDGYMDLTLKFNAQDVAAALGTVEEGQCFVVHLTATLFDGTQITGEDVIRINLE
jgi:hypothetical protein